MTTIRLPTVIWPRITCMPPTTSTSAVPRMVVVADHQAEERLLPGHLDARVHRRCRRRSRSVRLSSGSRAKLLTSRIDEKIS